MARWSLHPTAHASARILLIPTAFGMDIQAPTAILNAGADLCAFEPCLGIDVDSLAIGQLSGLMDEPPFSMCEAAVQQALRRQQWPVLLPSGMPASWGAIRAVWKHHPLLTVVHWGAHANILASAEQMQGDPEVGYGTWSWLERIYQYQLGLVYVGLRSSTGRGWQWIQEHQTPVFLAHQGWDPQQLVAALPPHPVFLVIDSNVLDPSVIPTVSYPEPGGLAWSDLLDNCRAIFAARPVLGVALGGLTVANGTKQAARSLARLLNWLLACHAFYADQSNKKTPEGSLESAGK
ncbi:MAG: arginase family protein [Cyanobacteriota bacterium]|nr:arginase family protein [Cyanobacteriota bacterium]